MEGFEFYNPTRIIFGRGEHKKIGNYTASKGLKKALVVIGGGSVERIGVLDAVLSSLRHSGVEPYVLRGVKSNPLLSKVREGIELASKEGVHGVIGLGGGSVMDTAKAIAAGVEMKRAGKDIWDAFTGRADIENALSVFTIPTIAASGSEMNGYMVITDEVSAYKLAAGSIYVYPDISILDPELTYSVPQDYTAYGGVDAVCHLMEPYFNGPYPYTPIQDAISEGLMRTIMDAAIDCIRFPDSYEYRAAMMWGATLALNGLTKAGVGEHFFPVHLIEHAISALYDVPHGAGLAALLPAWMTFFMSRRPERIISFSKGVMGIVDDVGVDQIAALGIKAFSDWLKRINAPINLRDIGIKEDALGSIADNALVQARIWGMKDEWDKDAILTVLTMAIDWREQ